ncbi:MAG: NADH-quinone oxidoreductase subunit NuoK [Deltaproteobacteria bacterium]|nr:NADH-quinone oxidoreductase subunit NuoK [Deltaproteobacteria bacterium]
MITEYFILSGILFTIGVLGVLVRKNLIVILMSLEIMMASSHLALVAAGNLAQNLSGQIFALFSIAVAAAEVAIGLALVVIIYKKKQTTNVDRFNILQG